MYDFGLPVTLQASIANPLAAATTDCTLPQGNAGFVVPTGYKFHALFISVMSNADLTAGTLIAKVAADSTELTGGPTATLSDTVQKASGTKRVGADPIAAGKVVSLSVTTDAGYLPVTADIDVVMAGVFVTSMKLTVISKYTSQKAQYEAGREIEVSPEEADFLMNDAPGCFEPVETAPVDDDQDTGEKEETAPG